MNLWTLNSAFLSEPWRLLTCHLVHHDLEHAAGNFLALAVPFFLVERGSRLRLALWLLLLAPLLSLSLLPFLNGGQYCGASALACTAWTFAGLQLAASREKALPGVLLLGLLAAKLCLESFTGAGLLAHSGRWQTLSESHWLGSLAGCLAAVLDRSLARLAKALKGRNQFAMNVNTGLQRP